MLEGCTMVIRFVASRKAERLARHVKKPGVSISREQFDHSIEIAAGRVKACWGPVVTNCLSFPKNALISLSFRSFIGIKM